MSFPVTQEQRAMFLERLAQTCNVTASAEAAGISRGGLYMIREREPEFAAAWDAALVRIADRVRDAIVEEAVEGVSVDLGGVIAKRRNTQLLTKLAIKLGVLDAEKPSVAVQTNVNVDAPRPAGTTKTDLRAAMTQLLKEMPVDAQFTPVPDAGQAQATDPNEETL